MADDSNTVVPGPRKSREGSVQRLLLESEGFDVLKYSTVSPREDCISTERSDILRNMGFPRNWNG